MSPSGYKLPRLYAHPKSFTNLYKPRAYKRQFTVSNVGYYETQCYNNRSTRKLVIAKWFQTSYLIGIIPITETKWGGAFQVTGMIEWGHKSKPKQILRASNKTSKNPPKNPMTNFQAIKISRKQQMI